jgi:hypothetical protein
MQPCLHMTRGKLGRDQCFAERRDPDDSSTNEIQKLNNISLYTCTVLFNTTNVLGRLEYSKSQSFVYCEALKPSLNSVSWSPGF